MSFTFFLFCVGLALQSQAFFVFGFYAIHFSIFNFIISARVLMQAGGKMVSLLPFLLALAWVTHQLLKTLLETLKSS
jgi:hypothetical protein